MQDIINICSIVVDRLSKMDNEVEDGFSSEKLIFPLKNQKKGVVVRISEQELRLVFIEEFKTQNTDLFYSIETPTTEKYKFGKSLEELISNEKDKDATKQSALTDLCIFQRANKKYMRLLNIEFKHKNCTLDKIAKDILKLIKEKEDGAFIHLLDNRDKSTLCNTRSTGVIDKIHLSIESFKHLWNDEEKSIQIFILLLKENILIHRTIQKADLFRLNDIFIQNSHDIEIISQLKKNGWKLS